MLLECLRIAKITKFPGQVTQLSPYQVDGNTITFSKSIIFNIDEILNGKETFKRAKFQESDLVEEILRNR